MIKTHKTSANGDVAKQLLDDIEAKLVGALDECRIGYLGTEPRLCFTGVWTSLSEEISNFRQLHNNDKSFEIENHIQHLLGQRPEMLSGGESVLAAITLLSVMKPHIWVLDRCFEWLDPEKINAVREHFLGESVRGAKIHEIYDRHPYLSLEKRPDYLSKLERLGSIPAASGFIIFENIIGGYDPGFKVGPINLKIQAGSAYPLVGANGAGKSTFAKILSGVIRSSGNCVYSSNDDKGHTLRAVYAFQNPNSQIFRSTVRQELEEIAKRRKSFSADFSNKISEAFGIHHLMNHDPLHLSIREKRLVTIAAAMISKAELIIIDEPTAFLSIEDLTNLLSVIKMLIKQGSTVLAITHNLDFATLLNEHRLRMSNGNLILERIE